MYVYIHIYIYILYIGNDCSFSVVKIPFRRVLTFDPQQSQHEDMDYLDVHPNWYNDYGYHSYTDTEMQSVYIHRQYIYI